MTCISKKGWRALLSLGVTSHPVEVFLYRSETTSAGQTGHLVQQWHGRSDLHACHCLTNHTYFQHSMDPWGGLFVRNIFSKNLGYLSNSHSWGEFWEIAGLVFFGNWASSACCAILWSLFVQLYIRAVSFLFFCSMFLTSSENTV